MLGAAEAYTPAGTSIEAVGSRVVVVATDSGETTHPFGDATSWAPRWSPDGETLAAYVQQGETLPQLGFWTRATGGTRLVADARVKPFFNFEVPEWTPDSAAVVVKLRSAGADVPGPRAHPPIGSTRVLSTVDEVAAKDALAGFADTRRADLAVVQRETGEIRRLVEGWSVTGWRMAPDGSAVAVLRMTSTSLEEQKVFYDLIAMPLEGWQHRTLAKDIAEDYGIAFSWSPDATRIAYYVLEQGTPVRMCVVASDGSGESREITDEATRGPTLKPMDESYSYSGPRWASADEIVMPHPKGYARLSVHGGATLVASECTSGWLQRPLAATFDVSRPIALDRDSDTMDLVVRALDFPTGQATELHHLPAQASNLSFAVDVGDDAIYLALAATDHPIEIWQYDRDFQQGQRILDLNPSLDRTALGGARLVRWRANSTEQLRGTLKLPPEYDASEPLPLIVNAYGGFLESCQLHSFDFDAVIHCHLLTSRGYAVLIPDMPMTDTPPVHQFAGSVLPAIASLVEERLVDPARIGIMGNSFGSYTTLVLLTQTSIFKAAVVSAPIANPISSYLAINDVGDTLQGFWEAGQGRLGGTLWERRDTYIENSPMLHLDRVTTPVLVGTGTRGLSGETEQGIEIFTGLRRLGKDAEIRIYEGEDHWSGMWSEASYVDFAERALDWFSRYLGQADLAAPMTSSTRTR